MNCFRCHLPMNTKSYIYSCSCGVELNQANQTGSFTVGPYRIKFFADMGRTDEAMVRTIICKDFRQLQLYYEVPLNISETSLDVIWNRIKENA